MKRKFWFMVLVSAVLFSSAPVLADGDFYVVVAGGAVGTKITSLPYTITKAGFYYLGDSLNSTSDGIIVLTDDVTIDLMGFSLSGNSGGKGISMSGRSNVEVRNGTMRYFASGIFEDSASSSRHRIINVRVENCTTNGISLIGNTHLVKGCTVSGGTSGIHIDTGTISGCQVQGARFGIGSTAGNMVGNFVLMADDPTVIVGMVGTGDHMMDQNTVIKLGDWGMPYDILGTSAWGTNAGDHL
jgi:hypothetical protein